MKKYENIHPRIKIGQYNYTGLNIYNLKIKTQFSFCFLFCFCFCFLFCFVFVFCFCFCFCFVLFFGGFLFVFCFCLFVCLFVCLFFKCFPNFPFLCYHTKSEPTLTNRNDSKVIRFRTTFLLLPWSKCIHSNLKGSIITFKLNLDVIYRPHGHVLSLKWLFLIKNGNFFTFDCCGVRTSL